MTKQDESDEGLEFCPFCGERMSGQMAENELKPCQCGSDVELCRGDDDYYIYCPKCRLKTFSDRVYDNIIDNCDRLIEAWNRRANDGRE